MKIKRIVSWLLILLICFNLTACEIKYTPSDNTSSSASETVTSNESDITDSSDESSSENNSETDTNNQNISPLLYKVTDSDGNVVWLFGSIHVGRENYYPLPDYVLDAFDNSDALAVECNVTEFEKDFNRQYKVLSKLIYMDGTTIQDHIPEELYEKSVEILEELNLYSPQLDYYMPILWSQSIESASYEIYGAYTEYGIDVNLMDRAVENDKEILEIESVEFQYQMLADFSEELQILLLQSTVDSYGEDNSLEAELNYLLDLWASGDEDEFSEYLTDDTSDLTDTEKQLYNEYNNAMVVDRNINMADYAENALQSGDEIFICVGAAHVVGDGGIADLLLERGYTVEIIK